MKGKGGEEEGWFLVNSYSDFVILPKKVVEKIKPEPLGEKEELEVGGGAKVSGPVYRLKLEVIDSGGRRREAEVKGVMIEGEERVVIGEKASEKLGIKIDLETGEYELKEKKEKEIFERIRQS